MYSNTIVRPELMLAAVGEGEGSGFLFVSRIGTMTDGRGQYLWQVMDHRALVIAHGRDLFSGASGVGDAPLPIMLSFISFLAAAVESNGTGENGDLFSAEVRDWAYHNQTELHLLAYDLERESN